MLRFITAHQTLDGWHWEVWEALQYEGLAGDLHHIRKVAKFGEGSVLTVLPWGFKDFIEAQVRGYQDGQR